MLNRHTFRDTGDEGADYVVNPRDVEAMVWEEFFSDGHLVVRTCTVYISS